MFRFLRKGAIVDFLRMLGSRIGIIGDTPRYPNNKGDEAKVGSQIRILTSCRTMKLLHVLRKVLRKLNDFRGYGGIWSSDRISVLHSSVNKKM